MGGTAIHARYTRVLDHGADATMHMPDRRIQSMLPLVLGALLLALIVYRGVAFYAQWQSEPQPVVATPVKAATATQPASAAQNYAALAQLHLFGAPAAQSKQAPKKEIPETRAQLNLHGVFVDGERSGAIIGEQNGRQHFVLIHGELPNGIKLKEVYADRVILERNGKDEALRFPKVHALLGTADDGADSPAREADPDSGPTSAPAPTSERQPNVLSQPEETFRIFPVQKSGEFVGYRVLPGRERGLYRRLGLQPADIVTAVGGDPVAENAPDRLAQQLALDGDVSITVQRGDRVVQLHPTAL